MTAYGTSRTAIEAMQLGAYDYLTKPFDLEELVNLAQKALAHSHACAYQFSEANSPVQPEELLGRSPAMATVFKLIGRVAQSNTTVLITGESGTGKELVASTLHASSSRSRGPLVKVNCAALPEHLLEAELFGHEKGAFTGATHLRIGRFEQANGGTIFLDEIGELSNIIQGKLLRVLQDKSFERLGSVWSEKELEAVVPILQSLDPPGIGARSLQECLLLQLKNQPQSLAFLLVQEYLEDLANCTGNSSQAKYHREVLLQKLRQRQQISLDVDIKAITDAIHKIQELEPRPARNFGINNAPIVTPDLKAELTASGWLVSLAYEVEQRFCLNSEAIELLQKSPQRKDTQRLEAMLQRAKSLLTVLHLWSENLLKVGQFLVNRQQAFLQSRDKLDLVPTPQQLVAQSVGLSNSTVSRIVRGRYILICDQHSRTIPLYSLCVPVRVGGRTPQQVEQLLKQLIEEESPTQPYSDEQLAQLLRIKFALPITRRTVTKYRKIAGINSSHRRRR